MWVDFGLAFLAFGIGAGSAGAIYLVKEKINRYTNARPKELDVLEGNFYSTYNDISSETYTLPYPKSEIEKGTKKLRLIQQASKELKKFERKSLTRRNHFKKFSKELDNELLEVRQELKKNLEIDKKLKKLGI